MPNMIRMHIDIVTCNTAARSLHVLDCPGLDYLVQFFDDTTLNLLRSLRLLTFLASVTNTLTSSSPGRLGRNGYTPIFD
jgi:hypothetical protein